MGGDFQHVEVNSFGQRSAFSDDGDVSDLDIEGGRDVGRDVPVSLLVSVVFGHVVEVISSDDDGPVHFGGDDDAFQDFASDGDVASEGTFLIDVGAFDGFLGGLEAQSDVLDVPHSAGGLLGQQFFAVEEDVFLFLESLFVLQLSTGYLDISHGHENIKYFN